MNDHDKVSMLSNVPSSFSRKLTCDVDNFKPAAIDYSIPGTLIASEETAGEVSLALPSTAVIPSAIRSCNRD
jgi:hypothetical protein